MRTTLLLFFVVVAVLPLACSPEYEPRERTVESIASFFSAHPSEWNAAITRLHDDSDFPTIDASGSPPRLETWLTDTDPRLKAFAQMSIDSVYSRQVNSRPVLFIEVCRSPEGDSASAVGYAIRLDSSAGAQDPLSEDFVTHGAPDSQTQYSFRHLMGGLHTFLGRPGRPEPARPAG